MCNVAKIIPAVSNFICKTLALDATAAAHKETEEGIRLVFLGEERLVTDLRHLKTSMAISFKILAVSKKM